MCIWKNLLMTFSAIWLAHAVQAQDYSSNTGTVVGLYPPGGATDLHACSVANGLPELGQTTVVDNCAGASGMIGGEYASRWSARGHNLLTGGLSMFSVFPPFNNRMREIYQHIESVFKMGSHPFYVVMQATLQVAKTMNTSVPKVRLGGVDMESTLSTLEDVAMRQTAENAMWKKEITCSKNLLDGCVAVAL